MQRAAVYFRLYNLCFRQTDSVFREINAGRLSGIIVVTENLIRVFGVLFVFEGRVSVYVRLVKEELKGPFQILVNLYQRLTVHFF